MRNWVKLIVSKLRTRKTPIQGFELTPLYPQPENDHEIYVQALEGAFRDKNIKNIALTGGYGSGKSSVIKAFVKGKESKTIYISFSTLGAALENYVNDSPSEKSDNQCDTKANLIQKEIVKQIFYHEKYAKVPASRFPRLYSTKLREVIAWSLALDIIICATLYLFGRVSILSFSRERASFFVSMLFVLIAFLIQKFLPALKGIRLNSIVGSTTKGSSSLSVTLSTAENYFDKYLDEIIYFFDVTKYRIVVLEDVDRFNDMYIFENLRQLNNLLNNTKQIGDKPIRFIYAIKDSIFESHSSHKEVQRTGNRTKFFDLIIPTIPFITNKNSRDILGELFEDGKVDRGVVTLASKYITDMRLVKNIKNEFRIFDEKVIKPKKIEDLLPTNLFAFVVFKNIYLKEFELIRPGESVLDRIYLLSRTHIQEMHDKYLEDSITLNQKINGFDGIENRCRNYGMKLIAHILQEAESRNAAPFTYIFNAETLASSTDLISRGFWVEMQSVDEGVTLQVDCILRTNRNATTQVIISKGDIAGIIGEPLDMSVWREDELEPLQKQRAELLENAQSILTRNIKDLIQLFPDFAKKVRNKTQGGLLYDLFAAGYINEDYYLYTSIYREHTISAHGMNFIVHNLQKNRQEASYKFNSDKEIEDTLREIDPIYFENRSIYNFDILNYLLKKDDPRADSIIALLAAGGVEDIEFLDKIIVSGTETDYLIGRLVKRWTGIFKYIIEQGLYTTEQKNRFLNVAILNGNPALSYASSHEVSAYLSEHANEIEVLKENKSNKETEIASQILSHFDVELLSLEGIKNKKLIEYIETNDLYEINLRNIAALIETKNLSLSSIKQQNPHLFARMCKHLDLYLDAINKSNETEFSVENIEDFVEVLTNTDGQTTDVIKVFVEMATDSCVVDDINLVDTRLWQLLFEERRVTNFVSNVIDYYDFREKELDPALWTFLNKEMSLTDGKAVTDEAAKEAFAVKVLNSNSVEVKVKASVVHSLELSQYLNLSDFNAQPGELYGLLVEKNIIEDEATTFNELSVMDWATKEHFIAKSSKFEEYMANITLSSDDINGITTSSIVRSATKAFLAQNALAYKEQMTPAGASKLIEFAIQNNLPLNKSSLDTLLPGSIRPVAAHLVGISLPQLSKEDLIALLTFVGGNYAKLVRPGKHPSLSNTDYNIAICQRLEHEGIVNSLNEKDGRLKVNVKVKFS